MAGSGQPGVPTVDEDPISKADGLRLNDTAQGSPVRVVLAELDPPGPLHYLIEGEGFQVAGCASDEYELARILARSTPDVIVIDAEVSATSVLIAQNVSPASQLIVVWPDGVQLPSAAERVSPKLVYQDLGPAIRRAADARRMRHPSIDGQDEAEDAIVEVPTAAEEPRTGVGRTSARVLVGSVVLITLIVVTMGASFAVQGWRASHEAGAPRTDVSPSVAVRTPATGHRSASPGQSTHGHQPNAPACASDGNANRRSPNAHATTHAHPRTDPAVCQTHGGGTHDGSGHANGSGNATHDQPAHGGGGAPGHETGGGTGTGSGSAGGGSHGPPDAPGSSAPRSHPGASPHG